MNGADLVAQRLRHFGVDRLFTLCGHGLDDLHDSCIRAGIRLIDTHNEQSAAYMAETDARLARRIGVCAVSSGVAHANGMTGVVNAYYDGAPLLLISGADQEATYGLGHFQELDQVAMSAPVCKYAKRISHVDFIGAAVDEACAAAISGRPGPVHLTIPMDVQAMNAVEGLPPTRLVSGEAETVGAGDPDRISAAVEMIDRSEKPLIIAGSGVYYSRGEAALAELASLREIPVAIPLWDRGAVLHPIPEFCGVLGSASGEPDLLADSDLVIMAGGRTDYRVGFLRPPAVNAEAKLIRVSVDADELGQGRIADLSILGDPASIFGQFNQRLSKTHSSWRQEARRRWEEFRSLFRDASPPSSPNRMNGRQVVETLRPFLKEETILLIDGGDIGQWAHMLLTDRYPGHWLTCGPSGVVGWGLPGAISAKLACPDRAVILLSGDGAANFTIAELEIASRHKTPIVMIVADDEAWGVTAAGQRRRYGKEVSSLIGPIQFDLVAQGFGIDGVRAADPAELESALSSALASDRPTLIHAPTVMWSPTDVVGRRG